MMKTSRLPAETQEECGVWLDTADLRRKKKAARPLCRITKLLSPLAPSRVYRAPVALSFTQTPMQFPTTTQSSITSFLSPHRHAKEEVESPAVMVTPLSPPDTTALRKKRKNLGAPKEPAYQRVGGVVPGLRPLTQTRAGGGTRGDSRRLGGSLSPLLVEEEEEEEPAKKRLRPPNSSETLPCQLIQRNHVLSQYGERKENIQSPPLPPSSPLSPKSTPRQRESCCLSPRKLPLRDLQETQAESCSQLFTLDSEGRQVIAHPGSVYRTPMKDSTNRTLWGEQHRTVPSRPLLQGKPESELGPEMLFTQDSEGRQVIAHPGAVCRTPMQDSTNLTFWGEQPRTVPSQPLLQGELLFTQDSEGNRIIKH